MILKFRPDAVLSPHQTAQYFFLMMALAVICFVPFAEADSLAGKGGLPHMQTQAPTGRIVVKLAPESGLVMGSDGLMIRPGMPASHQDQWQKNLAAIKQLITQQINPAKAGTRLEKRIPTAQVTSGNMMLLNGPAGMEHLPDLALYGHFDCTEMDRQQLVRIAAALTAHPLVEVAFLEPVAVPAALGFDAFTGQGPEPSPNKNNSPLLTDDHTPLQEYLQAAPLGVGALPMRDTPGQRAAGVTVIDVEGGWLWDHEDLPEPVVDLGVHIDDLSWRNHGTAVVGEIRGTDNGFGVVGITPDCMVGNSSIGNISTAGALAAAMDALSPGDIILIELHAPGPNSNGEGQFGYVPMEFWQDNFDVIRLATSRGIIVCEAAGNGYQNLDGEEYLGFFDRSQRDSGAIMCGATAGGELHSADFSNNGERVDLNGWGWYVTTCGYGDLEGEFEEEWYTSSFSGTSSASPIVTGAVASLQGMVRELYGFDLDARLARDLLRETGTAMEYGTLIGTRPDLEQAYALAASGLGQVTGTVTNASGGAPLAGVLVQVAGGGSFTTTDENGQWRLPLVPGQVNLEFSSFYFGTTELTGTLASGQTLVLDSALHPLPLINISGTVFGQDQGTLDDVTVSVISHPISGTTSGAGGQYVINQVPAGHDYTLLFGGLPGYGAQVVAVATSGFTGDALANPQLTTIQESFELGNGQFVSAVGHWSHGTPPASVVSAAFDGNMCWGVGMDGDYGDDETGLLTSPIYDLTDLETDNYQLSFHYFSATEPGFDGVSLEASDGGPFQLLYPLSGYSDPSLSGLGGTPGWSGSSEGWQGAVFDISPYLGGNFQFRLNWGSDGGLAAQGFYIDGITFGSGDRITPALSEDFPLAPVTSLRAWPNPFNPRVKLEYSLPQPGAVQIVVFDVRGRKVTTLLDQVVDTPRGTLTWDGQNDKGRQVASGVYFVLVAPKQGQPAVSRVVLSK